MKIQTVSKILLIVQLSQARQITKVEGLGEIGHFGIKLLHSLLPQRGERRISEDEDSVEARFFQQQQNCPFGQCGGNSGLQLVYPTHNSNRKVDQVKEHVYQTSFTSNGYNPTLDDMVAPSQLHFQPITQGQQPPKPVLNHGDQQQTSFNTKQVINTPQSISLGHNHHTAPQETANVIGQSNDYYKYQTVFKTLKNQQSSTSPKPVFTSNLNQQIYDTKRADQPIEVEKVPVAAPSGGQDEAGCVCVPVAQCPSAAQAVFLGNKNYAGLISPRNHHGSHISSGSRRRGKSIKLTESENELENTESAGKKLSKDSTESPIDGETVEATTTIVNEETTQENIDETTVNTVDETTVNTVDASTLNTVQETTEKVLSRRKRDSNDLINRGARLQNVYIPDDEITADDVTADDITADDVTADDTSDDDVTTEEAEAATEVVDAAEGSVTVEPANAPESRDSHSDIISDYKEKIKEERRKKKKEERKKNRKNKNKNSKVEIPSEIDDLDIDYIDEEVEDKSFDSISSFTTDVKDKVGTGVNSVTSGVTSLFSGLNNLISTKTSTGQLKPIVGLSFGLPQNAPGYGGYQNNPVNSGSAVNPYYTAQDGVELGPVNFNPLFSLQAGTNDNGELSVQPLVNLHLTPNGCGILGCQEYDRYGNPTVPRKIADALLNPIDAIKKPLDFLINKGQEFANSVTGGSGSGTQYNNYASNSGYGVPFDNYGAPSTNYGAPSTNYGAPSTNYGAPSTNYGAPSAAYGAPAPSYNVPAPSYKAPSTSYNNQVNSYGAPAVSYDATNNYYASTDYAAPVATSNQGSYGSTSDGYGVPSVSNAPAYQQDYSAPKPSYNTPSSGYSAPKPSYNNNNAAGGYIAPSSSYNSQDAFTPVDPPHHHNHQHSGHHDEGAQAQAPASVNIHHHYHHGDSSNNADLSQGYFRKEGDVNSLYLNNDDDIFKRETVPNSSGALPTNMPAKGNTAQQQQAGFKFPGSRNIHLGGNGEKRPLHLRDREPHSLDVAGGLKVNANQLQTEQMESPTCGGPGSGFVCCRYS